MKKNPWNILKTIALIIICSLLISQLESLPWWVSFLATFLIGCWISYKEWEMHAFGIGFLCGFLIWAGGNLYVDTTSNGLVLDKIGHLLGLPTIAVLVIAGIIGGLCSGLALYSGKLMLKTNKIKDAGLKFVN
jgi:hypothetical protein